MIPAVITDPSSGQPVVVASLERQRVAVEKEIKEACNEFLNEPDWNKNMSIVDQLNRAPYLCPFAIKEIRTQLKTKNPEIEILALQLAETIIKNCPSSHAAIAQEDFMRYLVKVGTDQRQGGKWTQLKSKMKKKNTSINSKHVRSQCIEKALLILQMLSIAYSDSNLYPVFRATVRQLESQKIRFPATNKDESLNIFSPIHSTQADAPTALGSVQNINSNLPMIRPVVLHEDLIHPELIQAQEQAQLLWTMVNAPVLSYDLIPDLTSMLTNSQQQIVVMISEGGNGNEAVLMQALAVNDIVNQVLEDGQAIMNGTKRRFQAEVDVQKLVMQKSDSERKDGNDDEDVSLEHSISIGDEDGDMLKLSAPNGDKLKKRHSKKGKVGDLLGMNGSANDQDLLSMEVKPKKKEESEENILDFLGVQNEPKQVQQSNGNVNVFDPLADMGSTQQSQQAPPPAFSGPNYGNMSYTNPNANNNGNVFRQSNNNKPKMNQIERGNASVLNVLTGEPSHSTSTTQTQNSSQASSQKQTPNKQPKQQYNLGGNNNGNKPKESDPFDTGIDPFSGFGGGNGKLFDDKNNGNIIKPKVSEKKTQSIESDPFSGMGGNAFDDPIMSGGANNNKAKENIFAQPKPAPPKKVDSNAIILDMFAAGASPDPNVNQPKAKPKPKPKPKPKAKEENPFDELSNPFGSNNNLQSSGNNNASAADNPFDALENNPFGASPDGNAVGGGGDDNPFDELSNPFGSNNNNLQNNGNKQNDPFADMYME